MPKGNNEKLLWFATLRIGEDLTQSELAEKAEVSDSFISAIELGYKLPSLMVAYRLSKILKFPMEWFIEGSKAA